ncbi:MAG: hypothetical protein Q9227_005431 [Pyrenula ochraceoflavens]
MLPELHQLDPTGDVTLVLYRDRATSEESPNGCSDAQSNNEETTLAGSIIEQAFINGEWKSESGTTSSDLDHRTTVRVEVLFVVCSRTLSRVSPVFRRMLTGVFEEAITLRSKGAVDIPLEDDDPDALLILMNLAHSRFQKIPSRLNLDSVTQIACLVDKYEMPELVKLNMKSWISDLWWPLTDELELPPRPLIEAPSLLFILWVFREDERGKLRQLIRHTVKWTQGDFDPTFLPIPQIIPGKFLETSSIGNQC